MNISRMMPRMMQPTSPLFITAEQVVAQTLLELPPDVREACAALPLLLRSVPDADEMAEGVESDTMGLFHGACRLDFGQEEPLAAPRITLYLENIWEEAGADEEVYREEVRLTLLHELGHYLGWDEEEIAARGLE
jgi:predicted Zn-dependent protease with MMP-like domain